MNSKVRKYLYDHVEETYAANVEYIPETATIKEVCNFIYDLEADYYADDTIYDTFLNEYDDYESQMLAYNDIQDDFSLLDTLYNRNRYNSNELFTYGYVGMYTVLYKYYIDEYLYDIVCNYINGVYD